jgi:tetratricopeptide (TPR) repeat protein
MRLPLHQSGRLTEARAGYKSVLRKTPGNYHAWHFLGLLERQLGKPQDAATCIKRALAISASSRGFIRGEYMFYNFGRIHKSLRVTPAMEAKVSDHVWSLEEIAKLAN